MRKVRLGVIGLGRAFSLMVPTFARHPLVEIVAGTDLRREAREKFASDFAARAYASTDALCSDPQVEAVYISTPHELHAPQALLAASRGKHILVEKPMALTLADCTAMIEAARAAGIVLMVGPSHSFDAPIARARELIAGGAFGELRMIHALNYTDWLYRPRRPEELDPQAGGVLVNQAPHQVDLVRLIGGGRVRAVRALVGAWDRARPTPAAYAAHLIFESGAFASLTYSGYGHFDSDEFTGWVGETGEAKDAARYGQARALLADLATPAQETSLKAAGNYGGSNYRGPDRSGTATTAPGHHQHFGLVIASCERADLRPTPEGVMIYADDRARLDPLPPRQVARSEVIDEFHAAVVDGRPPLHDGAWSRATMEVCFAMLESARTGKEIPLAHQVGVA
jgi:phthalate 4,5-cis-dihydrodiol dehydrogenase